MCVPKHYAVCTSPHRSGNEFQSMQGGADAAAVAATAAAVGTPAAALELFSFTPTYLLPRHAHFPPLAARLQITAAYADAPKSGNITIVYTYLVLNAAPWAADAAAAQQLTRCASAIVRDGLLAYGGYEVRENGGADFLLAFDAAAAALHFAAAMLLAFAQARRTARCQSLKPLKLLQKLPCMSVHTCVLVFCPPPPPPLHHHTFCCDAACHHAHLLATRPLTAIAPSQLTQSNHGPIHRPRCSFPGRMTAAPSATPPPPLAVARRRRGPSCVSA